MPLLPPSGDSRKARPRAIPTLYATPEPTPLPETSTPSSFPPSPYVVNHKRRGPRLLKSFSQHDVKESSDADADAKPIATSKSFSDGVLAATSAENGSSDLEKKFEEDDTRGPRDGEAEAEAAVEAEVEEEGEGGVDDFFDPRESMSVASSRSGNAEDDSTTSGNRWKGGGSVSAAEYYDAFEEISSECTLQSPARNIEAEIREMRLNLLLEIDKCKQTEDTMSNLQNYWKILCNQLSLVGITLPDLSSIAEGKIDDFSFDTSEELQRQVMLARLVAGSIGRGSARAEVEMEVASQIEAKNFEIARLTDRLHYYEEANRKMSQRNQEAVERARQERQKTSQMWIWGSMGLAIAIGVAAAAWSHYQVESLPVPSESSSSDCQQHT